jgi:N-methylhydantoinase A/oxoprolinase/acetone carboxylase beta subunit
VTSVAALAALDGAAVTDRLGALEAELRAATAGGGEGLRAHGFLHMRLRGQAYDVRVAVPDGGAEPAALEALFAAEYRRRHGRPPSDGAVEVAHWTVRLIAAQSWAGVAPPPDAAAPPGAGAAAAQAAATRDVHLGAAGWVPAAVVAFDTLAAGRTIAGPAIVEYPATTAVIGVGQTGRLNAALDLEVAVDAR